jgi:ribosomal protein L34
LPNSKPLGSLPSKRTFSPLSKEKQVRLKKDKTILPSISGEKEKFGFRNRITWAISVFILAIVVKKGGAD